MCQVRASGRTEHPDFPPFSAGVAGGQEIADPYQLTSRAALLRLLHGRNSLTRRQDSGWSTDTSMAANSDDWPPELGALPVEPAAWSCARRARLGSISTAACWIGIWRSGSALPCRALPCSSAPASACRQDRPSPALADSHGNARLPTGSVAVMLTRRPSMRSYTAHEVRRYLVLGGAPSAT